MKFESNLAALSDLQCQVEEVITFIREGKLDKKIESLPKGLAHDVENDIGKYLSIVVTRCRESMDSFLGVVENKTGLETSYRDLVDE